MAELRGSYSTEIPPAKGSPKKKKPAQYNTFRDNPVAAQAAKAAPVAKPAQNPQNTFGGLLKVLRGEK